MLCKPSRFPSLLATLMLAQALLGACDPDAGNPPVARASASPTTIPENDGFQTAVTLDGSSSTDPVDDPDNSVPLDFRWIIRGDEYRFDDGTETSATPVVSFRGDRPATIELTVTDGDGLSNTAVFQTLITVAP